LLTLHGVPKPVYRAFELLHRLGDEQLPVEGRHATVDAWVVRGPDGVTVILSNHTLPRQPIQEERVHIELSAAPAPRAVTLERIDEDHANPKNAWQAMGEPEYLNPREVERLEEASRLVAEPWPWAYEGRTLRLNLTLPPHAVAALSVELPAQDRRPTP
jgi:xylan 1,4-beta-xylosidase